MARRDVVKLTLAQARVLSAMVAGHDLLVKPNGPRAFRCDGPISWKTWCALRDAKWIEYASHDYPGDYYRITALGREALARSAQRDAPPRPGDAMSQASEGA